MARPAIRSKTARLRSEVRALAREGHRVLDELIALDPPPHPVSAAPAYQKWYTRALPAVQHLAPERLTEFRNLYWEESRTHVNWGTYGISDYFRALIVAGPNDGYEGTKRQAVRLLTQQVGMVDAAAARVDSLLTDIRGVVQADLFDDELSAACTLLDAGHLRAAGTVAGVVLEQHLKHAAAQHQVPLPTNPTPQVIIQELRRGQVIDVPQLTLLQHLTSIRNLCAHAGPRQPAAAEVRDLIDRTEQVTKTLI